jgi:hypothetical protein
MAKTLSESAAEILKASMGAAKEAAKKLPAEMDDLGGPTVSDAEGGEVGKKAAANVAPAAKPATKGDAKSAKVQAMEETEADEETEIVAEEEVPSEETVIEASAEETEEVVVEAKDKKDDEEDEDEDEEMNEEQIVEVKKAMMKDMVKKHSKSMKEDVDALFNGESLSEEFRVKATTIFEAAVNSRVESIVEEVLEENDKVLVEAIEEIKNDISAQVDEYLNYVVEQWVEENKVAIEAGLRAELVDDFIGGLKNLFAEHYIEIPEEKVDVAEELAYKVAELEESVQSLTTSSEEKIAALTEELNAAKKNEAIRKACVDLTETQVAKMKSLAESVEFTTEGEFNDKLATIRENYFPSKTNVKSEVKALQETAEEEPEVAEVHGLMKHYVQAISKTAPKA